MWHDRIIAGNQRETQCEKKVSCISHLCLCAKGVKHVTFVKIIISSCGVT